MDQQLSYLDREVYTVGHFDTDGVDDSDIEGDAAKGIDVLSRREQRALDREVPWREITRSLRDTQDAYVQAIRKEFNNWMRYGSAQPLSD